MQLNTELARVMHTRMPSPRADELQIEVVIERTDYSPGRGDSRERWIREARAREALAIGVTTAVHAAYTWGKRPAFLGPNEWQEELGVDKRAVKESWGDSIKEQVAWIVANQFPEHFTLRWVPKRVKGAKVERMQVEDCRAGKPGVLVPSHITDAIGMAYVHLQRIRQLQDHPELAEA